MEILSYPPTPPLSGRKSGMSPYTNFLLNEDPISESIGPENHTWYAAFFLISTNLIYLLPTIYAYRIRQPIVATVIWVAMLISMTYHLCQTAGMCFLGTIYDWTFSDHIYALTMVSILIFFAIFNPVVKIVGQEKRESAQIWNSRDLSSSGFYPEKEENLIYDSWGATLMIVYFAVVYLSVRAHPYSMQSYLISITFGISLIFFKLLCVNLGETDHFSERVSGPDLGIAIVILVAGLVFFLLDSYITYWISHSIWHVLGGLGAYFYLAGLSRNFPSSYSPTLRVYHYFVPGYKTHVCCELTNKNLKRDR